MQQQKAIRNFVKQTLLAFAMFATSIFAGANAQAQSDGVIEAKAIPTDAMFLFSVRPKQIMAQKELEYLPMEIIAAMIEENVGIPIEQIERLDISGSVTQVDLDLSMVLQMEAGFQESTLDPSLFRGDWETEDGRTFRRSKVQPQSIGLTRWKNGRYIFGEVENAAKVMEGFEEGPLAEVASKIKGKELAIFLFAMEPARAMVNEQIQQVGQFAPPGFTNNVSVLAEDMKHMAVRWNVTSGKIQFVITAEEDGSIDAVDDAIVGLVSFIQEQYMQIVPLLFNQEQEMANAVTEYVGRLNEGYAELWKPTKSKNRLLIEFSPTDPLVVSSFFGLSSFSAGVMPMGVDFGGGAVGQPAMMAEQAMDQSGNDIKQLSLAIWNYESAYKKIPPAASVNGNDEPLLSWRVQILPFLDETELYQKFHLDEPWDSEHNIKLLPLMPKVFQSKREPLEPGLTRYAGVVGPECALDEILARKVAQITDGTSNTVWIVELDDEHAVPWTAPKDYYPDPENPADGLQLVESNDSYVFGFCDGSVQWVSIGQIANFWAFFTKSGGEVVQVQPLSNE